MRNEPGPTARPQNELSKPTQPLTTRWFEGLSTVLGRWNRRDQALLPRITLADGAVVVLTNPSKQIQTALKLTTPAATVSFDRNHRVTNAPDGFTTAEAIVVLSNDQVLRIRPETGWVDTKIGAAAKPLRTKDARVKVGDQLNSAVAAHFCSGSALTIQAVYLVHDGGTPLFKQAVRVEIDPQTPSDLSRDSKIPIERLLNRDPNLIIIETASGALYRLFRNGEQIIAESAPMDQNKSRVLYSLAHSECGLRVGERLPLLELPLKPDPIIMSTGIHSYSLLDIGKPSDELHSLWRSQSRSSITSCHTSFLPQKGEGVMLIQSGADVSFQVAAFLERSQQGAESPVFIELSTGNRLYCDSNVLMRSTGLLRCTLYPVGGNSETGSPIKYMRLHPDKEIASANIRDALQEQDQAGSIARALVECGLADATPQSMTTPQTPN